MADNHGIEPAVIDFSVLSSWMDEQCLAPGEIEGVETLAGGTQNVLLKFQRGGRSFVLRRGPPHLRPKSNDVIRREMRVLSALAGSDVPHPGFIAGCPDEAVMNGAVFYLMEPVDGFNPANGLPDLHRIDASIRHEMGLQAADAIAAPRRRRPHRRRARGLRPAGGLSRAPGAALDVASWSRTRRTRDIPDPTSPASTTVARWLDENRPAAWKPGIMHGDYHFSNVMFAYDSARMAAIVDWEMCTIGDPLLDLGWLMATWPQPGRPGSVGSPLATAGGLCTPEEALAHYAERTTRDLSAIAWYKVLACFKLGIVLEGTHARAFAGKAPKPVGDMLHATTVGLFQQALTLIADA